MPRAALLALLVALALPLGVAGAQPATPVAAPLDVAAPSDPATAGPSGPAVGPPAGTQASVHAGGTGVRPDLHEVAILTVGGGRTGFATQSADVGTALAVQRRAAGAELDRYALAAEFGATETDEARTTLLFEAATDVEIRLASLREEERQLRADYANRSIDAETYLTRLAHLDARAAALRSRLEAIRAHADEIPRFSMDGRIQRLESGLFGLEGPVRDRVLATKAGEAGPTRLYVRVSGEGVVLSTIDGHRFLREAYRQDSLDPENVGGTSFSEAVDITERLYAPFAYNQSLTVRNELVGPESGIYLFTMELRTGLVTAYLDGATGGVFFEVQERRIDQLDPPAGATGVANGTRLVANRSYPGGPMRLTVTDTEVDGPTPATVYVAGHPLETGPDGVVWTLAPPEPVEVTAVRPGGNVTISVRPLPVTPVGEREG